MLEFIQTSGDNIDILHTEGDTFKFVITTEEMPENTSLRLQISPTGRASDGKLIVKTFPISNNEFSVELNHDEIKGLVSGSEYCYRLTVFTVDGEIITTMSGNLIVKWGA